jgi:hypothetical protein
MAGEWEVQSEIPLSEWKPEGTAPAAGMEVVGSHPVAGPSGDLWTDIKRRAGTAGTEALGGFLGLPHAAAQGVDWLTSRLPYVPENTKTQDFVGSIKEPGDGGRPLFPAPGQAREMAYNTTGATEYVPATYAGRIGQAALNAGAMGGLAGLRAVPGAMGGGATSEMTGEWAADRGWSPAAQFFARLAGGLPGQAIGNVATRAPVKPLPDRISDPEKSTLARIASDYNIPLGVGDVTDNRFVRGLYSESGKMPLSGAQGFRDRQLDAWTRGVTQTFGEDSPRITPEVLNRARTRLGNEFDNIAARTDITLDPKVASDLSGVVSNMPYAGLSDAERNSVRALATTMVDQFDPATGVLRGDAYQRLTRKGSPFDIASNSGSANVREFAGNVRTVLEDALERSARPEDIAALQQARAQWKALKTVEPLTLRADAHGVATPSTGTISPAALRGAVNKSYERAAYDAPGQLPLNDLARIGQHFLKDSVPDSGTAMREGARHTIAGPATAAATALMAGEHLGMPIAASAALGAGTLGSGAAINWMLRNPDTLRRMLPNPAVSALTAAQPNQAAPFSFAPQEAPQ